jgi:hypothetical protein
MKLYTVYMEWTSPWGKTRFGRTPAGAWGTSGFNNSTRQGQRLMWWLNMLPENWGSLIFTEKLSEVDATNGPDISDGDSDAYYVDLSYKAEVGKTVGALWIVRNATKDEGDSTKSPYTSMNLWLNGKYNFDNFVFEWETDWGFGEASSDTDQKTFSAMVDLGYKTGDWTIGGLGLYGTGDNNPSDADVETAFANDKGTGRDFNPYQIMMGDYMNLWNADNPLSGNSIHPSLKIGSGNAGLWSIGGYAKFAMSPQVSFSGEVGYFSATDAPEGYDDSYGWEFGVGMGYKIMDNLMYNAHFSYLATGDYFKEGGNAVTEDIYLVAHALSMKF